MTSENLQMTCTSEAKWWKEAVVLAVVCGSFLFLGIGSTSFLDPDEGMYGAIAREMAEGGDWITPHFNGVRYLYKPPLYFWLISLTTFVFGPSEWAVRIWSSLPALGVALLIWRLGGWLYGRRGGVLAAIVFATSVGVFRYVRVASTDFLLVFSLTLAMYGFIKAALSQSSTVNRQSSIGSSEWRIANGQPSVVNWHPIFLFYLGMGLGVLSKGLIGLVFPLLIVGLFSLLIFMNNRWRYSFGGSLLATIRLLFMSRCALCGAFIFLALSLPWHIVAALRNPGFFQFYIVDNQFLRFLNSRAFIEDDVPVTTVAFLVLGFVWFFPWSLFIPAALSRGLFERRLEQPHVKHLRLLVWIWALAVIGFFSLSASKLEHYFLPVIPPLSLITGGLWIQGFASPRFVPSLERWLGVGALGCSLFGVGLLLFSDLLTPQALLAGLAELNVYYRILQEQGATLPFASVSPFVQLLKGLGIVLVVGFPLSFIFFRLRFPKASFISILLLGGAVALLVFRLDLVVESHHSSQAVARALMARSGPNDLIVHEGSLEYSGGLPFYTGRQIYLLNGRRGSLDFGSRYDDAKYLFLDNAKFFRAWEGDQRVFLVTRSEVQESVLKNLPSKTVFPVGRYGSRLLYTNRRMASSQSKIVKSEQ